jgi:hypothetical protein
VFPKFYQAAAICTLTGASAGGNGWAFIGVVGITNKSTLTSV